MPVAEAPFAVSKYQPNKSREGWALCLSGGVFRAALFHLRALRRLNEVGHLVTLQTFSSVSGGSIINGLLAKTWSGLARAKDGKRKFHSICRPHRTPPTRVLQPRPSDRSSAYGGTRPDELVAALERRSFRD
jgi:predicted acylesterase/phospholipase RssA